MARLGLDEKVVRNQFGIIKILEIGILRILLILRYALLMGSLCCEN